MDVINIGLEAELMAVNGKNMPVMLNKTDIPADSFPLLAEVRGEYATNTPAVIGNFMKEYTYVTRLIAENGFRSSIRGMWWVDEATCRTAMRVAREGEQKDDQATNVYDNLLVDGFFKYKNPETGKDEKRMVTAGLHIHFSVVSNVYAPNTKEFETFDLETPMTGKIKVVTGTKSVAGSTIPVQLIRSKCIAEIIVRTLDNVLGKKYCKYANPQEVPYRALGWYRQRGSGHFEYRSLPFNSQVMEDLPEIVETAFKIVKSVVTD